MFLIIYISILLWLILWRSGAALWLVSYVRHSLNHSRLIICSLKTTWDIATKITYIIIYALGITIKFLWPLNFEVNKSIFFIFDTKRNLWSFFFILPIDFYCSTPWEHFSFLLFNTAAMYIKASPKKLEISRDHLKSGSDKLIRYV